MPFLALNEGLAFFHNEFEIGWHQNFIENFMHNEENLLHVFNKANNETLGSLNGPVTFRQLANFVKALKTEEAKYVDISQQ